jgi:hypothetical protein
MTATPRHRRTGVEEPFTTLGKVDIIIIIIISIGHYHYHLLALMRVVCVYTIRIRVSSRAHLVMVSGHCRGDVIGGRGVSRLGDDVGIEAPPAGPRAGS